MKKLSLLLLIAVALGGCKKNNDNSPASPSVTDLLTAKHWQLTAYTTDYSNNGSVSVVDVYAAALPCYLDNTLTFVSTGTVETDEGLTKCDPAAPQKVLTSWSYNATRNELTASLPLSVMPGSFQSIPFDISGITATYLRISRKRIDLQSVTSETMVFKAL